LPISLDLVISQGAVFLTDLEEKRQPKMEITAALRVGNKVGNYNFAEI
jgi:hypothetical protein